MLQHTEAQMGLVSCAPGLFCFSFPTGNTRCSNWSEWELALEVRRMAPIQVRNIILSISEI